MTASGRGGRILVVGDIITDVLVVHSGEIAVDSDTPAMIRVAAGGSGANTAAWLAHAGAPVALLGVVGTDPAGAARVAELTAAGVDCSAVVRDPAAATGSIVVLTDGRHRSMFTDRGANHALSPSHVDAALGSDVTHVHLSGYTLLDESSRPAGLRTLALAAARGLSSSVDAASAAPLRSAGAFLDWVAGADLLLANLDEARVLTATVQGDPSTVAAALAGRVQEVVVKLGADGAVRAQGEEVSVVGAAPAAVVDTTGAGDAFAAGLLAARLAGAGLDAALTQAVRLGARAVTLVGGRPPPR